MHALQPQVIRTKVMSPGGNAMGFINCEQRNADRLKGVDKAAAAKAFRGDIDQFELSASQRVDARALFALEGSSC